MATANSDATSSSTIDTSSVTTAIQNMEQVYDFAVETSSTITDVKLVGDVAEDATKQRPQV